SELPAGRPPLSSSRAARRSPMAPSASTRSTRNVLGIIRVWWLIARRVPVRAHTSSMRSASARVSAIGFSQRMPLTSSSAARLTPPQPIKPARYGMVGLPLLLEELRQLVAVLLQQRVLRLGCLVHCLLG